MKSYDGADYYAGGEDVYSIVFRPGSGGAVYDFRIACRDDATCIITADTWSWCTVRWGEGCFFDAILHREMV